jgi:hypothetical protein
LKPRKRKVLLHLMPRAEKLLLLLKNLPKKMIKQNLVSKVVLLKKRSMKRKDELKVLQTKKRR